MERFDPGDWKINEIEELLRRDSKGYIQYKFTHDRSCVIPKNKIMYFRYKNIAAKCIMGRWNHFMWGEFVCKDGEFQLKKTNGAVCLTKVQYENVTKYVKPKKDDLLVIASLRGKTKHLLTYIEKEEVFSDKCKMRDLKTKAKPSKIKELEQVNLGSLV